MEVNDRWFHWDTQVSLRSSIEQNFAWSMFTCIALQALRASERHHVAIISYYSSVLAAMSLHIANLARAASETLGNGNLSNIRFLTPEAAVGHTVEVVHFIACQPRYSSDSAPQGHQLELGRRYVSLTRASERLYVWVSKMDLAEEEYTRKLQLFAKLTAIDFQQTDIVEAVRQLFSMHIRWEQARDLWSMWQWQSTSKRTETIIEMLARYTHQPSRSPCPDRYTSNLIHSLYKPDSLPNWSHGPAIHKQARCTLARPQLWKTFKVHCSKAGSYMLYRLRLALSFWHGIFKLKVWIRIFKPCALLWWYIQIDCFKNQSLPSQGWGTHLFYDFHVPGFQPILGCPLID